MSFLSHELMSLRCDVSKKCIQSAKNGEFQTSTLHILGLFTFCKPVPFHSAVLVRFQDSPHVEFISKRLSCSHAPFSSALFYNVNCLATFLFPKGKYLWSRYTTVTLASGSLSCRDLIKRFFITSQIFTILKQFGELSEEVRHPKSVHMLVLFCHSSNHSPSCRLSPR